MARGYTLYGAEVSYFTGKVRAYLRYKRIPFAEVLNTPDVYRQIILPRVGWPVIPVVTTPEDEIWQDSTEIIDALESRFPDPSIYPATVRQRVVALLLEVYGDEWLKLPAMHYRWNHNYEFAVHEFGRMSLPGATSEEQRAAGERISKPFAGALPFLGVTPETASAIENSYEALLGELDAHFAKHEFLLGTRPSIGDFGLFGPLYAHQYRDPVSGDLMKARAPNLVRWVERMRVPSNPKGGEFLPRDEVPETLMPILSRMMREMIPELVSVAHHLDHWQKGDSDGTPKVSGTDVPRALGQHAFKLGSVSGTRAIFPFELWMLQRPLDYIASLEEDDKLRVADILRRSGGETLMDFPAFPRIVRRNFKLALA